MDRRWRKVLPLERGAAATLRCCEMLYKLDEQLSSYKEDVPPFGRGKKKGMDSHFFVSSPFLD